MTSKQENWIMKDTKQCSYKIENAFLIILKLKKGSNNSQLLLIEALESKFQGFLDK